MARPGVFEKIGGGPARPTKLRRPADEHGTGVDSALSFDRDEPQDDFGGCGSDAVAEPARRIYEEVIPDLAHIDAIPGRDTGKTWDEVRDHWRSSRYDQSRAIGTVSVVHA
jgi:hypothetical protein